MKIPIKQLNDFFQYMFAEQDNEEVEPFFFTWRKWETFMESDWTGVLPYIDLSTMIDTDEIKICFNDICEQTIDEFLKQWIEKTEEIK